MSLNAAAPTDSHPEPPHLAKLYATLAVSGLLSLFLGVSPVCAQSADLGVTKAVDVATPNEGETIVYTVVLTNNGPDTATNVQVNDELPPGTTFDSRTTTSGIYISSTGVWILESIAAGASDTLTIAAIVDEGTAGTTIVNTANIAIADQPDGNAANDSASVPVAVQGADLGVVKTVDDPTPNEGATIEYRVVLANLGPDPATNVEVTDLLPPGVTFAGSAATGGTYASGTGIWALAAVAPAASDTLTITATVDPGGAGATIVNIAAVTASDQGDPVGANDSDTADITIPAPTISTEADQNFLVGDPATTVRAITVTDDSVAATVTALADIRIHIPAGFPASWNTADSAAVLAGPAASKVDDSVGFEDGGATLVLDVVTDFLPGEWITVSDLELKSFTAPAADGHLELEVSGAGSVAAVNDKTLTILAPISTRSTALEITPDGQELWVVNPDHGSVAVIATQGPGANTLLAEIPVGQAPWTLDVHPTNGEVWVGSQLDDHVYIIDAAARAVVDSIAAGFETFGVAIDPRGTFALASASGSDQVFVIDVETRAVIQTLDVYRRPRGIAWMGDASRAWISHLLMPEFFGRLSSVLAPAWSLEVDSLSQVFHSDLGGYPSTMQNLSVAPAPGDSVLWIPANMIHTSNGQLFGNPMTATNMFHAVIRPVDTGTGSDLVSQTYYLSESGTPVGGPIAVDFKGGSAYVANLHSENVTVLNTDILNNPGETAVIPAGKGPIGVVTHPTLERAYVANWLSRDVTVITTTTNSVVTTVPTTFSEVLPSAILNGKQLFFTSTGVMSFDGRASCASCHVFGTHDGRPWDLSQYGKHFRATPDIRGIGFTGAHGWTSGANEMADHAFGILEFSFGTGLIPTPNPPLGAPNDGLSQDMDDIGRWMTQLTHRGDTPFLNPDGTQTADADSGEVLFHDAIVGCASCHVPPLFTDSQLAMPFVKHDVGTIDPGDADAAPGLDTPSLIGVWDTGPYLHANEATTLEDVLTTFNPDDLHGTTSHLTPQEITWLATYLRSIAWPNAPGMPVDAPQPSASPGSVGLEFAFPNPFRTETSLRFALETSPSDVRVAIFDVSGRRVRSLLERRMTRGTHVVGWDSRNDHGARVAPGIYFARLFVNGKDRGVEKMTVVR